MSFNIYDCVNDLQDELIDAIKNEEITNEDEMQSRIFEFIDNQCIYYYNCLEIIKELQAYDWSEYPMECTKIEHVAFCALEEELMPQFNFDDLYNETVECDD